MRLVARRCSVVHGSEIHAHVEVLRPQLHRRRRELHIRRLSPQLLQHTPPKGEPLGQGLGGGRVGTLDRRTRHLGARALHELNTVDMPLLHVAEGRGAEAAGRGAQAEAAGDGLAGGLHLVLGHAVQDQPRGSEVLGQRAQHQRCLWIPLRKGTRPSTNLFLG